MSETAAARRRPTDEVDRWCEHFKAACRERGVRMTQQRFEVYRALAEDLTHPSVEHLYARLVPRLPTLSLATVYRVLESFAGAGLIHRVNLNDGATRFDANIAPHQHLVCRACGKVRDVSVANLARLPAPELSTSGFVAERLDIRIVGVCATCSAA